MTPNQVLEDAKSQFPILYYKDPDKLEKLLKRALGVYQDKAGVIKKVTTTGTETSVLIPDDMLSSIFASDKNSRYHEIIDDETSLSIEEDADSEGPYTFYYFVNLRDFDLDDDLPNGIAGTLIDYVVALIDIPNTERARAVALATGRQTELPSNDELNNRKALVEVYMEDNKAMVPMLSVF